MLNLDTEEDDEIDIGCAGGVDVSAFREYDVVDTPINSVAYTLTLKGLHGGHSGMDIHKGYANANKLMNRLLFTFTEKFALRIASVDGGGLRNAIPRESVAVVNLLIKMTKRLFKKEVVTLYSNTSTRVFSNRTESYCIVRTYCTPREGNGTRRCVASSLCSFQWSV